MKFKCGFTMNFLRRFEKRRPGVFKFVKIPKKFYDDCVHYEDGINSEYPSVVNETKTHYWINALEDKAKTKELIGRAYLYSEFDAWEPEWHPLVRSARATLKVLEGAA